MDSRKKQKMIRTLKQYVPVKANIKSFTVEKAPKYLAALLKSNKKMEAFLQCPEKEIQNAGIKVEEIDLPLFTELALYLKERQLEKKGVLMVSNSTKTKDKGAQWEFDHSKSWFTKVESAVLHERGRSEKKKKEELLMTRKNFDEKTQKRSTGLNPAVLMNPQLRAHYFPEQPLVTPELIKEIKEILDKG